MCVENLSFSEATVMYYKKLSSAARYYTRTDYLYRCMGTGMYTSGSDTGVALFSNLSTEELWMILTTNPFDLSFQVSILISDGYYASDAWTVLFNGAVYYDETDARGFFFAGTGADFYQKTYS